MRIIILLYLCFFAAGQAWAMKIGVVDLNRALNESESGIRSKNVLETKGRQKQQEFKLEEEELRQLADELRSNPLLTPKAKEQKQQQLLEGQDTLRAKVQKFEQQQYRVKYPKPGPSSLFHLEGKLVPIRRRTQALFFQQIPEVLKSL